MYKILITFLIFFIYLKKVLSTDAHTNLLEMLELNYPLEAKFEQIYKSEKNFGWMIIYGNGLARTEFAPPDNNIIVADGKWMIFHDPVIDRTTYIPLDSGILEALLNPNSLDKTNNFKVLEEVKPNSIEFTIEFNISNANQRVKITFNKKGHFFKSDY